MYGVISVAVLVAACLVQSSRAEVLNNGDVFQVYPALEDAPEGTTPLYFALMQSFSGGYVSAGGIPGLMVAMDEINNNSDILPGYSLHYTLSDNGCVRYQSHRTLFSQLRENNRTKIAAMGSGCTLATEPAAEISHFWNIPQISCHSSSPTLRNRERFRHYYQTIGSEENQGLADFGVIQYYGWKKVTIFQLDVDSFENVTIVLRERLEAIGVEVSVETFEEHQGTEALGEDPFDDGSRIYAWIMYDNFGRELLCKAHQKGLKYPLFTFLHPAWWVGNWWVGDGTVNYTCTAEEREAVVHRSIAVLLYEYYETLDDVAETGTSARQYEAGFRRHYDSFTVANLGEPNRFGQDCYDATWILALALNNTLTDLKENLTLNSRAVAEAGIGGEFKLEDFNYTTPTILETLSGHLSRTNFSGITGRIYFDDDGIRGGRRLFIYQMRYNKTDHLVQHEIARVDENFQFTYSNNESDETVWPAGIPYDGVPRNETVTVHVSVTVVLCIFATCGVIMTIAFLIFNLAARERKLIKLTSPNLNYIIGAGAILLYLAIYVMAVPSADSTTVAVLCNLSPWLTSLGLSLCFGTIMAKMGRVFYIFNNPSLQKKYKLKDPHLVLFVCALVAVDVIILFIYTLVEGVRGGLEPMRVSNTENPSETRGIMMVEYRFFIYTCNTLARDITLGVLYGYKILLHLATVVMALKTRKVKVKGLDDYREIVLATYVSSFVLVIILIFNIFVSDRIDLFSVLTSFGLFVGATAIMVLVFVPKMISLYRDPTGERVFSKTMPTSEHTQSTNGTKQQRLSESFPPPAMEINGSNTAVETTETQRKSSVVRVTFVETSTDGEL